MTEIIPDPDIKEFDGVYVGGKSVCHLMNIILADWQSTYGRRIRNFQI